MNLNPGVVGPVWSLYFTSHDTGYAVGSHHLTETGILRTTNGGTDWQAQTSGTTKILHAVYFINSRTGFIVGDSGVVLKTTNGGALGINDMQSDQRLFKIFPNPSHDNFTLEVSELSKNMNFIIYTVNGKEMINQQITDKKTQIDFRAFRPGVYFIKVRNEKVNNVGKIVKE